MISKFFEVLNFHQFIYDYTKYGICDKYGIQFHSWNRTECLVWLGHEWSQDDVSHPPLLACIIAKLSRGNLNFIIKTNKLKLELFVSLHG
jgi:hypothetical protein